MSLVLSGKGYPASTPNGKAGNLKVKLKIRNNTEFRREGADVFSTAKITVAQVRVRLM